VWISWINDEQGVASSDIDRAFVSSLYQRATTDFNSPDLWLKYLEWEQEILLDSEEVDEKGLESLRRTYALG
jgi:hypothetical protein